MLCNARLTLSFYHVAYLFTGATYLHIQVVHWSVSIVTNLVVITLTCSVTDVTC